ncbi:MAG: PQQ-binding-like beta-propeller repeat protein [Bacteroidales bacterium]|nr:PQQ-binding-like beta-propeller repeat protein [Bacteroidales bacterium]
MKMILVAAMAAGMAVTAMAQRPLRVAVLSDVHVTEGNRCDTLLRRAVADINAADYDIVVMNGDLTNQGLDSELKYVKSILDDIEHPLFVLPGNHENDWSQSATKTFVDLWSSDRFLWYNDSIVAIGINCGPYMKMGDGHVKREDLAWMERELDRLTQYGKRRVLSFNHYPVRKDDLDNYGTYAQTLTRYPVMLHVNGHYHHWQPYEIAGHIPAMMTRALAMKGDTLGGYAVVEITSDSLRVFNKPMGRAMERKAAFANNPQILPNAADSLMPQAETPFYADAASIFTRVAADAENVYFGNSLGEAVAVSKTTGERRWAVPTGASLFSRPAVLPGGKVAFPAAEAIWIINAATGQVVEKLPSAEGPYVADGLVDGDAYYQGGYKRIERRNALSGALVWSYDSLGNYCQGQPALSCDDLIFGAWDCAMRCIDAQTGALRWAWTNGSKQQLLSPGNVVPMVTDSAVIIVAPDRYMTSIDRRTGQTRWRDKSHRYRESMGASADGKVVYAKTMDGELVAVDAEAPVFTELWTVDMGIGYDHAPCPIVERDGVAYVGSRRGLLTAVDTRQGRVAWQRCLGSSEINGIDVDPVDGSLWLSLIEGTLFHLTVR